MLSVFSIPWPNKHLYIIEKRKIVVEFFSRKYDRFQTCMIDFMNNGCRKVFGESLWEKRIVDGRRRRGWIEPKFVAYFDGNRVSFRLVDSICSIRVKRSPDGAMDNTLFPNESREREWNIDCIRGMEEISKAKFCFPCSIDVRYRD